ncbi:MAG TPA: class I SAM-dependent methyltransferase [Acidimicrobiales bacterium]|jgi:SAM-dependent methyltransferase
MANNYFDARIATTMRQKWPELFEPDMIDPVVGLLAELADGGSALELGVGTGRIALPLSKRGVPVHGIDLSPDMVAEMRTQPGADDVTVTVGDFATTEIEGKFRLAYLVRNTITNLTTQEAQVACFRNVARHLEPGGLFLIECYIPALRFLPPGQTIRPFTTTSTHLGFEEYQFESQIAYSHHYWFDGDQVETFSAPFRYVWPSELDLMAQLAGMSLRHRWADWLRNPFTDESDHHISVWELPTN